MSSIILNCNTSTYIDNSLPNSNYSRSTNLFSGIIYKNPSKFFSYKTLLKFDLSKIKDEIVDNAYLYLFLEDLRSAGNNSLAIYENINDFNEYTLTWNNYPNINTSKKLTFNLENTDIDSYIKIDITNLVINWINEDYNYGLTIIPDSHTSPLIAQFSSDRSANSPYIEVICNLDENINNKPSDSIVLLEMYSTLIERCKSNEDSINNINLELNSKIDSLFENFNLLTDNLSIIDESLSNGLLKVSTLLEDIETMNIDINLLKDETNSLSVQHSNLSDNYSNLLKITSSLDESLDYNETKLNSLNEGVNTINKNITILEGDINSLSTSQSTLGNNYNSLSKNLLNIKESIADNTSNYKSLYTDINSFTIDINNLKYDLTSLSTKQDLLANNFTTLSTDLLNVKESLSNNASDYNSLLHDFDNLNTNINVIKNTTTSLSVQQETLDNSYDTLNKDLINSITNNNERFNNLINEIAPIKEVQNDLVENVVELSTEVTNINKTLSIISIEPIKPEEDTK